MPACRYDFVAGYTTKCINEATHICVFRKMNKVLRFCAFHERCLPDYWETLTPEEALILEILEG